MSSMNHKAVLLEEQKIASKNLNKQLSCRVLRVIFNCYRGYGKTWNQQAISRPSWS